MNKIKLNFNLSTQYSNFLMSANIKYFRPFSETGTDTNEWVFCIHQSSSITGTLSSDSLMSYLGHSLGWSYCYIIAEGFRFMPLSLVRLRTFRLSTWVSWVQH